MADRGILPRALGVRSVHGSPTIGILMPATGVCVLSALSFSEVVEIVNLLYCFGQIIEFAAFVQLRISHAHMTRSFRIPVNTLGAAVLLSFPLAFICVVISFSSPTNLIRSVVVSLLGVVVYYLLKLAKDRHWCKFNQAVPDVHTVNIRMCAPSLSVAMPLIASK